VIVLREFERICSIICMLANKVCLLRIYHKVMIVGVIIYDYNNCLVCQVFLDYIGISDVFSSLLCANIMSY